MFMDLNLTVFCRHENRAMAAATVCLMACFQHTEFAFNQRSTCMQNSTGSMIRCYFSNIHTCGVWISSTESDF